MADKPPAPLSASLLARKGAASAGGFGTAATLNAVAAEVARPVRPRTAIEFPRPSASAPDPDRAPTAVRVLIADGDALSRKALSRRAGGQRL